MEVAHKTAIHITPLSSTTLADANKLEETSSCNISRATTLVDRMNLNSADGHTKVTATWQALSGSMGGNVKVGSAAQGTMKSASEAGTAAYLHIIDNPSAETGEEKGRYYVILFESYEETREAGGLVPFTSNFKVDGAAVPILAT